MKSFPYNSRELPVEKCIYEWLFFGRVAFFFNEFFSWHPKAFHFIQKESFNYCILKTQSYQSLLTYWLASLTWHFSINTLWTSTYAIEKKKKTTNILLLYGKRKKFIIYFRMFKINNFIQHVAMSQREVVGSC